MHSPLGIFEALPGVLGIQGEGPFIFRELGSTGKYFKGSGEQSKTFGDLGSTVKNVKNKSEEKKIKINRKKEYFTD